jgi:hypothetical protein
VARERWRRSVRVIGCFLFSLNARSMPCGSGIVGIGRHESAEAGRRLAHFPGRLATSAVHKNRPPTRLIKKGLDFAARFALNNKASAHRRMH